MRGSEGKRSGSAWSVQWQSGACLLEAAVEPSAAQPPSRDPHQWCVADDSGGIGLDALARRSCDSLAAGGGGSGTAVAAGDRWLLPGG